jgi:hypothetical protein
MNTSIRTALLVGMAMCAASLSHAEDDWAIGSAWWSQYARDNCELEAKIYKNDDGEDFLHMLVKCNGKLDQHDDIGWYHPRGGPHDPDHRCKLDRVERLDKIAIHLYTTCKYHIAPETRGPLLIRFTGWNILITNSENF